MQHVQEAVMFGLLRLSVHLVALTLVVLTGAVFGQSGPLTATIPPSNISTTFTEAASGLTAPVWGTFAPGVAGRLFVADQSGLLVSVNIATPSLDDNTTFLDLRARPLAGLSPCNERGLLGVAFHPQYTTPGAAGFGRLYTYTSEMAGQAADFTTMPAGQTADHQSVIIEWQVDNPTDTSASVDPGGASVLLRIDQPQCDKNAGALSFGPDGMLYIALGDGGGVDDQGIGHGGMGNGQNTGTVLGGILRIDATSPNPLPGERYAYGLQNPLGLSFDPNGLLYAGDAGQLIQEINILVVDGNYGWTQKEGTFAFDTNGNLDGILGGDAPNDPMDLIDPVAQYDQDEGGSVVGGFVYRSSSSTLLSGRYIFGDKGDRSTGTSQCRGRVLVLQEIFDYGSDLVDSFVRDNDSLIRSSIAELGQGQLPGLCILGFGQDAAGEVYVLANDTGTPLPNASGTPTGVVMKINAP
jgi:hypothetical protein